MKALLMAGGEGRRLRPFTSAVPKPLLELGNRPILEHTLLHLRSHGILDVTLTVNYLAHMIEDRFGDGEGLQMRLRYQREELPLGTAGALREVADFHEPLLMMNGDILTDLDIGLMRSRHLASQAALTVASKVMATELSLGVLDTADDGSVTGYREKPRLLHRFGLGIYMVNPEVKALIEPGERIDAPALIARLIAHGKKVDYHDHPGRWVDIGLPEEYIRMRESFLNTQAEGPLAAGLESVPAVT